MQACSSQGNPAAMGPAHREGRHPRPAPVGGTRWQGGCRCDGRRPRAIHLAWPYHGTGPGPAHPGPAGAQRAGAGPCAAHGVRHRTRGLQAQLADLDAQQTIAKRKAERYDQLQGVVPQSAIDAAQLEWEACASAGRHCRPASTRPNCCAHRSPVWSVRCMPWRARPLMPAKPLSRW